MLKNSTWSIYSLITIVLVSLSSCSKEDVDVSPCVTGDCNAKMIFPTSKDQNGYYHVQLDWSRDFYPYFAVEAEASEVIPQYRYNETSVVVAEFDSNLIWTIGDSLVVPVTQYNPFTSNTSYNGTQFASQSYEKVLNYFKGVEVNIAQNTEIYFKKQNDGRFTTKRILGPFPPQTIGDTITLYMSVYWEAGNISEGKDGFTKKFIVE